MLFFGSPFFFCRSLFSLLFCLFRPAIFIYLCVSPLNLALFFRSSWAVISVTIAVAVSFVDAAQQSAECKLHDDYFDFDFILYTQLMLFFMQFSCSAATHTNTHTAATVSVRVSVTLVLRKQTVNRKREFRKCEKEMKR